MGASPLLLNTLPPIWDVGLNVPNRITLDDSSGRVMPPNVRLVIPALAGIVAVRAKAQPSGVVLIGFLIHFRYASHLTIPSPVFEPPQEVLPRESAVPREYRLAVPILVRVHR